MRKPILGLCDFVPIRPFSPGSAPPIAALQGSTTTGGGTQHGLQGQLSFRDVAGYVQRSGRRERPVSFKKHELLPINALVRWGDRTWMLSAEVVLGVSAVCASFAFEPLQRTDGVPLVALFLLLAIASDAFAIVSDRGLNVSGSLLAIVLAIALTGPTGGVLVGTLSALVDALRVRRPLSSSICNVAGYALFPFAGGVTVDR